MRIVSGIPAAGRWVWLFGALLLIVPLITDLALRPVVDKAERLYGVTQPVAIKLPDFIHTPNNTMTSYDLDISRKDWPVARAYIIADDCIKAIVANGVPIPLTPGMTCNYPAGLSIDLGPYLHTGDNKVQFVIWNRSGMSGISLSPSALPLWVLIAIKTVGLATLVCAAFITAGSLQRFGMAANAIVFAALCLAFLRYFSTNYTQFTYDLGGHLDYIRSLAIKHELPEPFGWQSQHPPLYHILAAAFYLAGRTMGMQDPVVAVRFLSFLLYTGYVWLALLTLSEYFGRSRWLALAAALLLFWPVSMAYAGWINDDVPIFFLGALLLYLLVRWAKTGMWHYLEYGIVLAFIAMMFKGTGIILIGTAGLVALDALLQRKIRIRALCHWPIPVAGVAMLFIYFGRIAYYRFWEHADVKWFLNLNLNQIPDWLVENRLYDFLYFDLGHFLQEPFFSRNEPLFWNAFLKTLLFSEWVWQSPVLASTLSGLLVCMLVYLLWFLFSRPDVSALRSFLPPLALMVCMVSAMMIGRMNVPAAYQCNARYVVAITIPFVLFFVKALETCFQQGRKAAFLLGSVIATGFISCSLLMIVFEQLAILASIP